MTVTLTKTLLVAITLGVLAMGAPARADEFGGGQPSNDGSNAYLDRQATNSQLSDPTVRDSLRSHGRP